MFVGLTPFWTAALPFVSECPPEAGGNVLGSPVVPCEAMHMAHVVSDAPWVWPSMDALGFVRAAVVVLALALGLIAVRRVSQGRSVRSSWSISLLAALFGSVGALWHLGPGYFSFAAEEVVTRSLRNAQVEGTFSFGSTVCTTFAFNLAAGLLVASAAGLLVSGRSRNPQSRQA